MTVEVNYWAVIVAAIASMIIGFIWYGPLFGKKWLHLSGVKPGEIKRSMNATYALGFLGSLVMSFGLWHIIVMSIGFFQDSSIFSGITAAWWGWLGLVAPITLSTITWEGKSWTLWILNNAYYLITLSVMAAIMTAWM